MKKMGEERNTPKTPDTGENSENAAVRLHTLDMLVANIIPTTKYFESRFDFLQHQINELREGQKRLEDLMDLRFGYVEKRFEQIDHRFEQIDQRFEQIEKRFEQIDKRFEQVDARFNRITEDLKEFKRDVDGRFQQVITAIDRLTDKLDQRDEAQRRFTLKMFTIAISLSFLGVLGVFLKIAGVF